MKAIEIADGMYRLGVNLDSTHLFEGMWPMPDGISINSYVVQGEKTALIDFVEDIDGAGLLPVIPWSVICLAVNCWGRGFPSMR